MRRFPSLALLGAGAAALSLGVSACGGSASSTTTTAPPNPATAQADISASYQTLFDFADKSVTGKEAAIEDGSLLKTGLTKALSSSVAAGVSGAKVTSVTLLGTATCNADKATTPCASVAYGILASDGSVELPNQTGYASYVGGKWVVSKVTVCGLLETFYSIESLKGVPPGCPSS